MIPGDDLRHEPVLHTTVLATLAPVPGETVLDVTLGLGGHAAALLRAVGTSGRLIALDADPENLRLATELLGAAASRATLLHANFRDLPSLDLPPVDVLFADLGLSSPHVDDASRGFSFRADAPLDLRFDRATGMPASERLAGSSEEEILAMLRSYGELRGAHVLAGLLARDPPRTTFDVVRAAEAAYGWRAKRLLPQIFQALRIWVNDELAALGLLLECGPAMLRPGGRMGILSYHSLEDRLVKRAFRTLTTPVKDPITGKVAQAAPFTLLTPKAIRPDASEIARNPRSRSALFRAIRRS